MKNLLLLLALLIGTTISAQELTSIKASGKVINASTKDAMPFANVVLTNPIDNSQVVVVTTNDLGYYILEVKPGTYNLIVEFVGFKKSKLENIDLLNDIEIQDMEIVEDIEQLGDVTIVAQRTTVEFELDKKIYHVGNDITSKGGTVNDVLNNVPSVAVDNEGTVSLRGNSSVRILVNGKPSVITENGGLASIPAETIERVEISTNPGSQYDAEGTAGVINVILKKNKLGGFSSSIQLTSGIPHNHGINLNANYKKEKFNIFSNVSYRYYERIAFGSYTQTETSSLVQPTLEQTYDGLFRRNVFNIYVGGDYFLNDKNTLTFSFYHRNNFSRNTVDYRYEFKNNLDETDSIITSQESYREPQLASQFEINYVKDYNKKGQKLSAYIEYDFWNDDENESVQEQLISPINTPLNSIRSRDIESSDDVLFQSDYTHPLTENSKLELGLKGEIRNINSDYKVFTNDVLIDSLDNLLVYNEHIYGAYVQYGNNEKKFQYSLGLRAEHADTKSTDRKDQFKTGKKYTDLFPTVHLTYKASEKSSLQLSYSRRISRPQFYQINPFGGVADRRFIRFGNPDLNPMYTNSFELGTIKDIGKFNLNPSIYYQHTTNVFEWVRLQNDGFIGTTPINLSTEDRLGAELVLQYTPNNWWKLTGEVNIYGFERTGSFENISYDVKDNTLTSRLRSRMSFNDLSIETTLRYRGGRKTGQAEIDSQYWVDFGLSKDIWEDKASFSLNVGNVFNTLEFNQVITGETYIVQENAVWAPRRLTATFTYRLNRSKNDRDRTHE